MRQLSLRERRLIAVLILIAAVAAVLALVIGPIVDGFSARADQRLMLAQTFAANERRIAAVGALQHEAERQQGEMRTRFMAAPSADEANEALRERIEGVVAGLGGDVRASEAMPGEDGWARAAIEARMGHAQFATVLARLNDVRPALSVESVTVIADDALSNFKSDLVNVRIEATAPFLGPDGR